MAYSRIMKVIGKRAGIKQDIEVGGSSRTKSDAKLEESQGEKIAQKSVHLNGVFRK